MDGTTAPGTVGDPSIQGDKIVAVGCACAAGDSERWRFITQGQGPYFAYRGITTEVYGEETSPTAPWKSHRTQFTNSDNSPHHL